MPIRRFAFHAALVAGLATAPLAASAQYFYPPCSSFPLTWPFCATGAIVATIVTALVRNAALLLRVVLPVPPPPYYYYLQPGAARAAAIGAAGALYDDALGPDLAHGLELAWFFAANSAGQVSRWSRQPREVTLGIGGPSRYVFNPGLALGTVAFLLGTAEDRAQMRVVVN